MTTTLERHNSQSNNKKAAWTADPGYVELLDYRCSCSPTPLFENGFKGYDDIFLSSRSDREKMVGKLNKRFRKRKDSERAPIQKSPLVYLRLKGCPVVYLLSKEENYYSMDIFSRQDKILQIKISEVEETMWKNAKEKKSNDIKCNVNKMKHPKQGKYASVNSKASKLKLKLLKLRNLKSVILTKFGCVFEFFKIWKTLAVLQQNVRVLYALLGSQFNFIPGFVTHYVL
ncbi:hypothetical protein WN51_14604 [Melipona quadrifasciata]|uniref:Uncharacterized protein n=1 Tax=Melipona quadrifasciata TaxID=166423 RepID=A0A0M8ZXT2_9HYME|nr:hypothetical protein WN51_14604 [Melipona quadrifasciata]